MRPARGVPEGVRQLLKMALAVPEKKTHQAPEKELFFTRLGKAGLTLGAYGEPGAESELE